MNEDSKIPRGGGDSISITIRALIACLHVRLLLLLAVVSPLTGFLAIELAMGVSPQRLHWDGLMGLVRGYALFAALVLGLCGNNRTQSIVATSEASSQVAGVVEQARYLGSRMGVLALLLFVVVAMGYLISRLMSSSPGLHWHYWVALIAQGWIWFWVGSLWLVTARALEMLLGSSLAGHAITSIFVLLSMLKPLWTHVMAAELQLPAIVVTFLRWIIPDGHLWDLWTPGADLASGMLLQQGLGCTATLLLLIFVAWGVLWVASKVRNANSSLSD